ncbi:hypothetical protein [Paenibacillus vini]|uniref:Uncharacterized protein n=1 Tax=Paenibacillus vini TaxID=1476024 RepID=A0ABQ4M882_9BACL|nr:hypothetical protein [Paenibacillus vini]GIP52200.1 hypothetical protein J42TS3_12350 [Paenibacillus vini]
MKIENLSVGFVAKNYKELCTKLNEDVKNGKSKVLQLERWKCYFDYDKKGNSFIITEIFDNPKPLPTRGGNNITPYIADVKGLIIQLLLYSGDNRVLLPKNRLLVALNMINDNYRIGKKDIKGLSKQINIKEIDIYDFYNTTDDLLGRNVEKALNELQNTRAIYWSKVLMICKNNELREATNEEYNLILKVQVDVLNEMGYTGLVEVFKKGVTETFTNRTNKILNRIAGIDYIYEAYRIHLNEDRLVEVSEKMSKDEIKTKGKILNNQIKDRIKTNSVKRKARILEVYDEWFGLPNEKKSYRLDDNYLEKQFKLADVLIDIEHPSIL